MTMPEIKLPDGSIASFPDSMSDAEIEAVLQNQFPVTPKQRVRPPVPRQVDTLITITPPEELIDFFSARRSLRVLRRAPR